MVESTKKLISLSEPILLRLKEKLSIDDSEFVDVVHALNVIKELKTELNQKELEKFSSKKFKQKKLFNENY